MTDPNIIFCGVPEHFNFPLKEAIKHFDTYRWSDCPGGSGEMIERLANKEADIAIMLTEAAVFAVLSGHNIEIISEYVSTPIKWGIYSQLDGTYLSVKDDNLPLLISRKGSGSHLIPFSRANENHYTYHPQFVEVGNLSSALDYFKSGKKGLFYWEENSTDHLCAANNMKKVGSYPSPWPSFVMVKRRDSAFDPKPILKQCKQEVQRLKNQQSLAVIVISREYKLSTIAVEQWFRETEWFKQLLNIQHLETIAEVLKKEGLVDHTHFPDLIQDLEHKL